jgi:exo-beta-1,3-glucanase (GH17 family)
VNYGPYHRPGQDPNKEYKNDPIPVGHFRADLHEIVKKFSYIRTYGTETRLKELVPLIANEFSVKLDVYLGVYESKQWRKATEEQIEEAIRLAKTYPDVKYVIVGNECLDQDYAGANAVTVDQLIADINKVKQSVPASVKVTTCLGFHSALNPEKLEDGSPNGNYREGNDYGKKIMENQRPIP